jgi:phosphate transport system substrate-binding protein
MVASAVSSIGIAAVVAPAAAAKKKAADPYVIADVKGAPGSLTGAGSTFDQPLFTKAFYLYNQQNSAVTVNYAAIGSGGGISQFEANTVNFGATDVPMTPADIAKANGGQVLQVPVALGGVAMAYNIPGVKTGLKLTPSALAGIFLGTIKTWDDPAIKRQNPGVHLPSNSIVVAHRADGSGTTYIFTNYLSTVSPAWASGPGTGKSVSWPTGVAGQGTAGVAGIIEQTPNSIGYIELAYALQNKISYAKVKNAAGKFVAPSLTTVAADAAQKPDINSVNFSIVDQPGSNSYPISGYSWGLIYQLQKNAVTGSTLAKVLDWLSHAPGQTVAKSLDYVPLPANIQALARSTLLQVTGPDGKTILLTSS